MWREAFLISAVVFGALAWQPQNLTAQRFRVFRVSSTSTQPELDQLQRTWSLGLVAAALGDQPRPRLAERR